jgi:surface antigen
MKKFFVYSLFLFLLFYLASCGGYKNIEKKKNFELQMNNPMSKNRTNPSVFFEDENIYKKPEYKNKDYQLKDSKRSKLVNYALSFKGNLTVKKDKKFRNDCSGFVRSIYDNFNIELYNTEKVKDAGRWFSGTEIIYNFVKDNGKVFTNKQPRIGDIIFFDNTTDRNRDGLVNDKFTHIAIIVDVKSNGTIHYIHKSNRGINVQKMNLKYSNKAYIRTGKNKIKVNSYLRKKNKKDKNSTPYLSAQMFRAFGSVFK